MSPIPQLLLLACAALLCDCQPALTASQSTEAMLESVDGRLFLDDGERRLLAEDGSYRSFALNESAGCLVLSSLDEDLRVHSWVMPAGADAAAALSLPEQLPTLFSDEITVFSGLPDSIIDEEIRLSVVNPAAELIYTSENAILLAPAGSEVPAGEFCLLSWETVSEFSGLLEGPAIEIRSSRDGSALLQCPLELPAPPAELELLYLDEKTALLLVLYDIYMWQVVKLDRASAQVSLLYTLEGQPMYDKLLPTLDDRLSHVQYDGTFLTLDVISFAQGSLRLQMDPLSGLVIEIPDPGTFPVHENLPMSPADNSVIHSHLQQGIFPRNIGDNWRQKAYIDSQGRILLLSPDGPVWLSAK